MAGNLEKRLAKIEQLLAKKAQRKALANCNCRDERAIFFADEEGIEAELNLTCPVHGERRLARLLNVVIVGSKDIRIPNPKRDALKVEYERRYARQREQVPEDDAEQL